MPSIWSRFNSQLPKEVGFGCFTSKDQLNSSILTTLDSVQALEKISSITISACFFGYYPVSDFQLPEAWFTTVCRLREVISKMKIKSEVYIEYTHSGMLALCPIFACWTGHCVGYFECIIFLMRSPAKNLFPLASSWISATFTFL